MLLQLRGGPSVWVMGCITSVLVGCTPPPQVDQTQSHVVYDVDDRTDYHAHQSALLRRITRESIVALIRPGRLDRSDPQNIEVDYQPLGLKEDLCPNERFYNQPAAASCSGTLIDTDLVLTAGHCVEDLEECRSRVFVFNYFYQAEGQLGPITEEDIYECRQLVITRDTASGADFAIVQLDRPVTPPRRPVSVRTTNLPLTEGSTLAVIGFPSGIPAKIDNGGHVLSHDPTEPDVFQASLDTFDSNSGSGVFDETGALVGILSAGQPDYQQNGNCYVVNVIAESQTFGDAEDVAYAESAISGLCQETFWGTDLCGDTQGWCRPCQTLTTTTATTTCPAGWTCQVDQRDVGITFCAAPCTDPTDCDADHLCDGNHCRPRALNICARENVWEMNTCGREVEIVDSCYDGHEICLGGACASAGEGNFCNTAVALQPVNQTITGTLADLYDSQHGGSCGGSGKEIVYDIATDRPMTMTAQSTGFDTVLYVRETCRDPDSETVCADDTDPPGGRGSRITTRIEPGTWSLFLDAYGSSEGAFELDLRFTDLTPPDAGIHPDAEVFPDAVVHPDAAPDASVIDASVLDATGIDATIPQEEEEEGCSCQSAQPLRFRQLVRWGRRP